MINKSALFKSTLVGGVLGMMLASSANAEDRWIEANNVSLRYELSGNGKTTVVLLHEIGMSIEGWDEVVPSLSKGYKVLAYDQRGFGQSEKIRGPVTLADEVNDLRGLLDGLKLNEPVILVGGAIGGSIAVKFAAQYPDRVKGLVILSPVFRAPTARLAGAAMPAAPAPTAAPAAGARPATTDTATLIETQGVRAYLEQQLDNLYPAVLRTDPKRLARFYGIQMASDPTSRAAIVRMISQNGDVSADLPKIACPTLVVATSLFPLGPAANVKPIADIIPKARFVDLPTGHLAALESPEMVVQMLTKFFAEI
ncbi:MAG: alpha/beta hydrolase [Steroidobacteraceae bacterium]